MASDSLSVGTYDEEHLRRFLAARDEGDEDAMRAWWGELVIDVRDRMDGFVAGAHKGRLDDDEHDEAVQLALIRFGANMQTSFKGRSMGELINATKTMARGICIDVQRKAVRLGAHVDGSFDDWDATDADGAPQSWADAEGAQIAFERRVEADEAADFVAFALARLDDRSRRVIELTLANAPLEEVMDELGVSRANAYQLRSRAMKALAKLWQEWIS